MIRSITTDMTINPKIQKQIDRFYKKQSVTQVGLSIGSMGRRHEEGKAKEVEVMNHVGMEW